MTDYILELREITKTFGSLVANDRIDMCVQRGTVHAIVGENGAGKSTLMSILTDIYKADSGEILLNGRSVTFKSPMDAVSHGIGMVYQEFMLCGDLSVLDNIMLGFERTRGIFLDKKKARAEVQAICSKYHFRLPLDALVRDLSVALLQQVEIVKVLYKGAELIIMDEPTSVLTPQGIDGLFEAIRNLIADGKTILFISHKLNEVFEIADNITVLKDGKVVGNCPVSAINKSALCALMVGREVALEAEKLPCNAGDVCLSVQHLSVKAPDGTMRVKDVSFDVRYGEIVGIAGVAGSGQRELVEALYGMCDAEKGGKVLFYGVDLTHASPRKHLLAGMGYVPQDRMGEGCAKNMSLWENAIMGYHISHGFRHKALISRKEANVFTDLIVEDFSVKRKSNADRIGTLSGGNVQKAIVGREFNQDKKLYIMEDPTRGIDVGAIEFIWKKMIDIAHRGAAVLLISHELNEIMQLSDRILVAFDGQLFDGGAHGERSDHELGILMTGGA